jgi:hypothetical protein
MRLPRFFPALPLAVAALAVAAPGSAKAQDYDMDCKLLLCLPGGFPDGCGDAFDHMIDRLRDGKSPIGFCGVAGGGAYDDYEIDYAFHRAASPSGWECPEGSTLHHSVHDEDDRQTVSVFCYESSNTVRLGDNRRAYYTGMSRPERTDFTLDERQHGHALRDRPDAVQHRLRPRRVHQHPLRRMIGGFRLSVLAVLLALAPAAAGAQVACLPPEEPYPYEPSDLDPELRAIVNEQYEDYVRNIEVYINCLEAERVEAMQTAQEVVQRWVRYFGDDAALHYEVAPDDMPPPPTPVQPTN